MGKPDERTDIRTSWSEQRAEDFALTKSAKSSICGALIGAIGAAALVILFRHNQSPIIFKFFLDVDRLAYLAANYMTSLWFPGDRIHRVVSIDAFFDAVLVMATGLQGAILGFGANLLARRRVHTR